jgi:16S rRNA (uracil1498-N3)-methyltransferase
MMTKPARVRPRFLAPDFDPAAFDPCLPAEESRHLTRVLRLGPGAVVSVFDGRGGEWVARVTSTRDAQVTLAVLEPVEPAAESRVPFTLVQALLKGAAMDEIVRDATMMGAAAIQPVLTRHTAARPGRAARGATLERWHRLAVASAKQCRRAVVPAVLEPVPVHEALAVHSDALELLFVEPSAGVPSRSMRTFVGSTPPAHAALIVGPEGGWATEELDLARSLGAVPVTLGPLTLRAAAVPVAAMAIFRVLWE